MNQKLQQSLDIPTANICCLWLHRSCNPFAWSMQCILVSRAEWEESTLDCAKALSIHLSRKTDNEFRSLYPLLVTWLLGGSSIVLITTEANIICGVSHFGSFSDCYLIAGSRQNHFNDAQTVEIFKQTQRQGGVKELKSADRALPSSSHCWCAVWPWMLLWENRQREQDPVNPGKGKDLFEDQASM